MKKAVMSVLLILMTLLVGCSDGESGSDEYATKIFDLSKRQESLVTNPTKEYVMAALHQLESVTGVEADLDVGTGVIDASMEKECVARVYFTSDLVDQSDFDETVSVLEKGTSAGGSIDIYENQDDAISRDMYLHGFDGKVIFNSGSHAVAGTIVIRTSEKLDSDTQEKLTQDIVDMLTSGDISDEVIGTALAEIEQEEQERKNKLDELKTAAEATKATKEVEKNKIEVGYDSTELVNMRYDDVSELLANEGFTNIVLSPQETTFDLEKESKCTNISINGEEKFNNDDRFNPDDEIVICYWSGKTVKVPDSWTNLVELHYEEVEKKFIDAGFTDVAVQPHEIDYDESKVFEGSVVNIEVGYNATFEATDEFYTNVPVRIDYRVKPKSTPAPEPQPGQQTKLPSEDTSGEGEKGFSSGGTGVTVPQQEETGANLVWVPTNGGTKYHSSAGCSRMKDPMQVSLDTAVANGYTPCKRCH